MADRRKIMTIFGSRPEGIKMAPVIQALRSRSDWFETVVVSTGQHREQLDLVFDAFDLKPDYDLAIMKPRQTLIEIMVRALSGLDEVLAKEKPDHVEALRATFMWSSRFVSTANLSAMVSISQCSLMCP